MTLYLASKSPRRQELLKQIGVNFELLDIDVDETCMEHENPEDYVSRITLAKATAGKTILAEKNNHQSQVLAADTSVVLDNKVLGKAENKTEAENMLKQLSGRTHQVLTAVAVYHEEAKLLLSKNTVCFKTLSNDEIQQYIQQGEPLGKAGGYAIQGYAATFICHIEGSYSSIMGLPLYETALLLDI